MQKHAKHFQTQYHSVFVKMFKTYVAFTPLVLDVIILSLEAINLPSNSSMCAADVMKL